jgi:hypothetical protein
MRIKLLPAITAALLVGTLVAGVPSAATTPKKVGGSVTFSLTPPAAGARSGPFGGKVSSPRAFCRSHRSVTLIPFSDNFPNVTGYLAHAKTTSSGNFSGTYTTPKKKGTSSFILQVDKARRKHKGQIYLCKALRAPSQSVTTTD